MHGTLNTFRSVEWFPVESFCVVCRPLRSTRYVIFANWTKNLERLSPVIAEGAATTRLVNPTIRSDPRGSTLFIRPVRAVGSGTSTAGTATRIAECVFCFFFCMSRAFGGCLLFGVLHLEVCSQVLIIVAP